MTRARIRVIKVGGSLLECEQLPQLLTRWLAQADHDHANEASEKVARVDILIAGGGTLAEHVRQLDKRFALDSETSHWMSVSAMSCTSRLLASLLNAGPPCERWDDLQVIVSGGRSQLTVFDAQQWLTEMEGSHPGIRLTHDWQTTSDSIAGRLARVLCADELVLLKSTDIPTGIDWRAATEQGLVDGRFLQIAAELPRVVCVNLRQFEDPPATASRPLSDAAPSPEATR
jgi:aspartokinase-like uncharacterized kinase